MSHKLTDGGQVLHVGTLARVEGEGAMHIEIKDGRVEQVQLRIFEAPQFYEAFLRGRAWTELPDITARICGICPVAYQFSSCLAIEDACGVVVPDAIRTMRRLLYCGEWIESHALHIYLLHAPDFLGYPGAIEMAKAGERVRLQRPRRHGPADAVDRIPYQPAVNAARNRAERSQQLIEICRHTPPRT